MTQAQLLADVSDAVVQVAFWTSLAFIPGVSLFWAWWREPFGRTTMSIDLLLTLAFLPAILRIYLGIGAGEAWYEWFTLAVVACIPVRTALLAWAIWRLQRKGRAA